MIRFRLYWMQTQMPLVPQESVMRNSSDRWLYSSKTKMNQMKTSETEFSLSLLDWVLMSSNLTLACLLKMSHLFVLFKTQPRLKSSKSLSKTRLLNSHTRNTSQTDLLKPEVNLAWNTLESEMIFRSSSM